MKLNFEVIYLDTTVIVSENILAGRKINELATMSKNDLIDLRLSEVSFQEVLKKIREHTIEAFSKLNKSHSLLNNQAKILKNISLYKEFFHFPAMEMEEAILELQNKFKDFVKTNKIKIESVENVKISSIFQDYFASNKPFDKGKKKNEFPDAFVIASIENQANSTMVPTVIVSTDKDMKDYIPKTKFLEIYADLSSLLDKLNSSISQYNNRINFIKSSVPQRFSEIENYIKKNLVDDISLLIYDKLQCDSDFPDVEYDIGTIKDINLENIDVIKIEDEMVELNLSINLLLRLPISYTDYSFASYDKEDDVWYNLEYVNNIKNYSVDIEVIAIFIYEEENENNIYFDFDTLEDISLIDFTD